MFLKMLCFPILRGKKKCPSPSAPLSLRPWHDAHRYNIKISLSIVYFWPLDAIVKDGFLNFGSGRAEVFCKEGVLRNFTKFTGKHLCQSLFLNKVGDVRPATLSKKWLKHRCFPGNFVKFLRTPFLREHLWTTAS